jgi:heme/copper-type cytochrome/quinol oxidase subunit 2
MPLFVYYILFATIMLLAVLATFFVGFSKKNKEGNPSYDTKTKSNWSRLSWIYIIIIILGYVALVAYIVKINT